MKEDKTLKCIGCNGDFVFTKEEQELFELRGYQNEPKRCPDCRRQRRDQGGGGRGFGGYGGHRRSGGGGGGFRQEQSTITCGKCGKEATVPFKPRMDKPVYCSDCFRIVRAGEGSETGKPI